MLEQVLPGEPETMDIGTAVGDVEEVQMRDYRPEAQNANNGRRREAYDAGSDDDNHGDGPSGVSCAQQ